MKRLLAMLIAGMLIGPLAHADCVTGASMALSFTVLDAHTIVLNGPRKILITSFAFFYPTSDVKILEDSFCDYASNVLFVDGEVVSVNHVTTIN